MKECIGIHYRTGRPIRLKWHRGNIEEIQELSDGIGDDLPYLAPGLVDLQVNGYGGYDLNAWPMEEEHVRHVTRGLWKEGVTSYFPTIITNSNEAIERAVGVISAVCDKEKGMDRCIAGIHLEGPFISPEEGPRGAHHREYVKGPDWSLFQRWQEAAGGRIKVVTLSPEWPGAGEFIQRCAAQGVIVSIGHTAATPEQIREAVNAGASMSTHLGNGAHLLLPRHPNYLWEQLAQEDLWSCMIADGFHLPESVLKVILRVKGEKALLVSDSVSFCGMEPGEYTTHIGGKVVLTPEGKLHLAENPNLLAGSAQTLKWGVEHLKNTGWCPLSEAWEMASTRPSRAANLPGREGLAEGAPADFLLFQRKKSALHLLKTYKHGDCVYHARNVKGDGS
ncbi:N-acetylglucosamine-6-phosphate deacetylase [Melghirimyces profundicolus]|uniref:N-acetylglucosamine-6-phosphate deacetylase n=1 Tax=Melghirimyces profundicolus TaxID=1242148 RepID=A0A2T6C0I1_9BACL|nr:amidohydrolase family protein [Melghirimyces profundicolus]PTX61833.1 N-acetylglucosamine-6-phosphate deacetylase [Melghirimyces profundicolus]